MDELENTPPAEFTGGIPVRNEDIPEEFRGRLQVATQETPQYIDFFDVLEEYRFDLGDGVQYLYLKAMTEGDRKRFLNITNREVRMNASTKEMRMRAAAGDDKHELLKLAITSWHVLRQGQPVPFTPHNVVQALEAWPPALVDKIEKKVQEINPWLLGDENNLEALIEEREQLDQRIAKIKERGAKN